MNFSEEPRYRSFVERTPREVAPAAYASLMRNVYLWMALALTMTGMTAFYVAKSEAVLMWLFSSEMTFYGVIIAELALVWSLSALINRLSFAVAGVMFAAYSILNGVTLSAILLAYTEQSIATAFFTTAGMFFALALFGTVTKRDLSTVGRIAFMALIGLVIASVVNMFLNNETIHYITSYIGVVVFTALTAYDAQKIKHLLLEHGHQEDEATMKIALMGSLTLYLDFINLFLYLLRIFGNRR